MHDVDFEGLQPGTLVKAKTKNTLYQFKVTEDGIYVYDGGKRFEKFEKTDLCYLRVGYRAVFQHPHVEASSVWTTIVQSISVENF